VCEHHVDARAVEMPTQAERGIGDRGRTTKGAPVRQWWKLGIDSTVWARSECDQ
jgi:hypothetical protein